MKKLIFLYFPLIFEGCRELCLLGNRYIIPVIFPVLNYTTQTVTHFHFRIVSRIMDYDPRDFYDEVEAQFADEMEAMEEMDKLQRELENEEPPSYM